MPWLRLNLSERGKRCATKMFQLAAQALALAVVAPWACLRGATGGWIARLCERNCGAVLALRPCVRRASILQFECLALLKCAGLVVSFPFPYLPTVLVSTFIPELTVFVVTSPRDEVAACVLKDRDNNGSRRREFAITGLAPTRHSRRESPQPSRDRTPGQGLQVPRPHVVWRSGRRSMESPAA